MAYSLTRGWWASLCISSLTGAVPSAGGPPQGSRGFKRFLLEGVLGFRALGCRAYVGYSDLGSVYLGCSVFGV